MTEPADLAALPHHAPAAPPGATGAPVAAAAPEGGVPPPAAPTAPALAPLRVPHAMAAAFGEDLAPRVEAFMAAVAAHRLTVDEPAPVEAPLIEAIARAGGMAALVIEAPEAPATPPAPLFIEKLILVERLSAVGLLRDARAALKIGQPDAELSDAELLLRERWDAAQRIAKNDAMVRDFLAGLGADPDALLA